MTNDARPRRFSFAPRAALLIGLAAALAACGGEEDQDDAGEARPVRTVTVEERTGGETVALSGTVESQVQADLAFRIGGLLVERPVNVGDEVTAGQLIARLDPTDEENALRAARASLAAAEGQLSEARINYDRQRQLYERQIAARAAFERAEQVYSTALAAVDAARAQAAIAQRRLDDTALYADAPGVVTARGAEPGEVVQPGRMIVEIARDQGKDAVFDVAAALIENAPPDPEVTITMPLNADVTAHGRVREVSPRADAVTGTFRVRVGLIDPPAEMRLGSNVTGRVVFGDQAAIEIPTSALTRADGEPAVWVVDPETHAVALRQIGVARFAPSSVVVSDGLEVGEIVVTAGVQALRPDQQVRLLDDAS